MFKKEKDLIERSRALLKNKECRKLKSDILVQVVGLTESDIDTILPNKCAVQQVKLASRTILYVVDNEPLFFDLNGRNNIYPTLLVLWRYPNCLRSLKIHSQVSEFILNGADLMLPGLANLDGLESLQKDEKVCVSTTCNIYPFAVGDSLVCWEAILVNGQRGKAMSVLHCYGDLLLPAFLTTNLAQVTPFGFSNSKITSAYQATATSDIAPLAPTSQNRYDKHIDNINSNIEDISSSSDTVEMPAEVVLSSVDSKSHMDKCVNHALCLALKFIVRDKQLPILASTLWSIVQKCATVDEILEDPEAILDIRKSSYRKVSLLMLHWQQAGMLSIATSSSSSSSSSADNADEDEVQHTSDVMSITEVNRKHELFKGAVPRASAVDIVNGSNNYDAFRAAVLGLSPADDGVQKKSAGTGSIQVIELYKLPRNYRSIFATDIANAALVSSASEDVQHENTQQLGQAGARSFSLSGEFGEYLRASEVKQLLVHHITLHGMDSKELVSDRACVCVTAGDDLYSLAGKCKSTTSTASATSRPAVSDAVGADHTDKTLLHKVADLTMSDAISDEDDDSDCPHIITSATSIANVFSAWGNKSSTTTGSKAVASQSSGSSASLANTVWKPVSLSSKPTMTAKTKSFAAAAASNSLKTPAASSSSFSPSAQGQWQSQKLAAKSEVPMTPPPCVIVRKEDLLKQLLQHLTGYYAIIQPNGSVSVHSGKPVQVVITVETRAGNKAVTRISGLEQFDIDLAKFAKDCQKKFACSVTVGAVAESQREHEVITQGHHATEVEGLLISSFGIPRLSVTHKGLSVSKKKKK